MVFKNLNLSSILFIKKKFALCAKACTPASVRPEPLIFIFDLSVLFNALCTRDWIETPFFCICQPT